MPLLRHKDTSTYGPHRPSHFDDLAILQDHTVSKRGILCNGWREMGCIWDILSLCDLRTLEIRWRGGYTAYVGTGHSALKRVTEQQTLAHSPAKDVFNCISPHCPAHRGQHRMRIDTWLDFGAPARVHFTCLSLSIILHFRVNHATHTLIPRRTTRFLASVTFFRMLLIISLSIISH